MRTKLTVVATAIAAVGFSAPAFARPLSEELQNLLTQHPMLKSARKSVEAADKARDAANSGYYPRFSISGDTGKEKITSESYKPDASMRLGNTGTVTPATQSDLSRRKLTATLEQNLYAGGRTAAAADIADTDYSVEQNNLRATTQDVLLEGITAYLQVARYQTLIAIARRNEETTQKQLGLESQRVERGGGIAVDVMQARTRLQIVKERRVFYEQGLRDAVANYTQVFGHAPDLSKIEDLEIYAERLPKTLEAALEQGRSQSPRLKEALYQSQKAQKQIDVEQSNMFPTVDLVGTHSKDNNVNQVANRDESSVLLKFNWNLFSGLETKSRTEAASLHHQAMYEREAAVLNKLDESIRIAWNQLINGRERQELLESAAGISYDVMQNRKRLRDAGKETAINVLDAEVEYYGVQSNRINAMYDTRIGSYRLLAAAGGLTPDALGLANGKFSMPVKPLSYDFGKATDDVAAPAPVAQAPASADADVEKAVQTWAAAWSAKDVDAYLNTYSKNFVAKDGSGRGKWEKQRAKRIGQAQWIKVGISDLKVETLPEGKLRATFNQVYESDRFKENVAKTLDLVAESGSLKIVAEQ